VFSSGTLSQAKHDLCRFSFFSCCIVIGAKVFRNGLEDESERCLAHKISAVVFLPGATSTNADNAVRRGNKPLT
jgi:hypothetical protein